MSSLSPGTAVGQRYQIKSLLQENGAVATYLAQDQQGEQTVILKALQVSQLKGWKGLELFEREAKTLANLEHPRIPKLLDSFNEESEQGPVQYLVSEKIEGETLAQRIKRGWKVNQTKALQIAKDLLEILFYLHQFSPPVIHRDIKPSNIILDAEDRAYLIDFGAVKDLNFGGETVVGTFGYMAPEQLANQTKSISDLYALGVTLVELLSHCPPEQIPRQDLHLKYHDLVNVSADCKIWLDGLLEPTPSQRTSSAEKALQQLEDLIAGKSLAPSSSLPALPSPSPVAVAAPPLVLEPVQPPLQTQIQCEVLEPGQIQLEIPDQKEGRFSHMASDWFGYFVIIGIPYGIAWAILSLWLPFWFLTGGASLAALVIFLLGCETNKSLFYQAKLAIEAGQLQINQGWREKQLKRAQSYDLKRIRWIDFNNSFGLALHLEDGTNQTVYFSKTPEEKNWIRYNLLKEVEPLVSPEQFQRFLSPVDPSASPQPPPASPVATPLPEQT